MLVLSRRMGEKIRIGDDIEVVVMSQRGRAVVVGIDAPAHIRIRREELLADTPVVAAGRSGGVTTNPREDEVVPATPPAVMGGGALRGPLGMRLAGRASTLARHAVG